MSEYAVDRLLHLFKALLAEEYERGQDHGFLKGYEQALEEVGVKWDGQRFVSVQEGGEP